MSKTPYVSVFKINGQPILPPLMTDSKRSEMLKYRELAIALENKRKNKEQPLAASPSIKTSSEDLTNDCSQVSKIEKPEQNSTSRSTVTTPTQTEPDKRIALQNLQKSDTFVYDIKNNTVIMPQNREKNKESPKKESPSRTIKGLDQEKIVSPKGKSVTASAIFENHQDDISKKYILFMEKAKALREMQRSPTLSQKSLESPQRPHTSTGAFATNFDKQIIKEIVETKTTINKTKNNQKMFTSRSDQISVDKSPPKKDEKIMSSSMSEAVQIPEAPKIIRSNSFTLETPSPVLLRHLRSQAQSTGEKPPPKEMSTPKKLNAKSDKTVSPNDPAKASVAKTVADKPASKVSSLIFSNTTVFKNKKSPYEIKSVNKNKIKKQKNVLKKSVSPKTGRSKPSSLISNAEIEKLSPHKLIENSKNIQNFKEIIKSIQEDHQLKLIELVRRQQEEQQKMQQAFAQQEKILLEQINMKMENISVKSPPRSETSTPQSESSGATIISKVSQNDTVYFSCLSPKMNTQNEELAPMASTLYKNYINTTKQSYDESLILSIPNLSLMDKNSPKCSRRLFTNKPETMSPVSPTQKKNDAAKIINACVRGYLTRRLFRTDHVQRIVQTIRDTLVFVLDLYDETKNDEETEESITLKARLLQQLTSACYELHEIFIKGSTKERMNLIAKDRAYIQSKAKSHSRLNSPRI